MVIMAIPIIAAKFHQMKVVDSAGVSGVELGEELGFGDEGVGVDPEVGVGFVVVV
jgi:hypothetical protein